ncbi:MAG TPA: hybrid sensor histidine kinase/response regulator [Longimicrobium sp.]|jgi:signal transduction histidine kinase
MIAAAPVSILLVEDNPGDARLLRETLREAEGFPFELSHALRLADAAAMFPRCAADVVLLDLSLPDAHGLDTVRRMLEVAPATPIIVLTGTDDERLALQAVHAGAQDYLTKGRVDGPLLARSIRYAIERNRLEQERAHLLRSEREARATAEAAAQARDEVLRVVSHDLGNYLGAASVNVAVLQRILPEGSEPMRERVAGIRDAVAQMQRLRQDLLDVASIEAGRLSVEPEPHDPATLLAEAAELFGPVAAEHGIELVLRPSEPLPAVRADRSRVLQVLGNLIGNAVKFTPRGGRITLAADAGAETVRLSVRDTGTGIPPEHLPHVFDRFWKVREGNRHGAGLGLAIARGIIEAHGGEIQVESTLGTGTTFTLTLPLA